MNRKIKLYARKTMSIVLVIIMTVILIPLVSEKNVEAAMLNNPRKDSNGNVTYDCVWFGSYPQSDATGVKKDPIKWRVLEVNENDAFLVADCNLDVQMYNDTFTYVTWESCTMRKWLNSDFVNRAFTSSEQSAIKTTTVVNADNPYYGTEGGNNTKDKVFLLSLDEVMDEKYGFSSYYNDYDEARRRENTVYVARGGIIGFGTMSNDDSIHWWYLRSPGKNSGSVANVGIFGCVYVYGSDVNSNRTAVCPALHLNLASSNLWSYAGTVCSDGRINENKTEETTKEKVKPISTTVQTVIGKGKVKASAITKIGKITAYKKSLKMAWKKVKDATGYEVQYGTVKKFKKAKKITIKGAKSTSKTIRKLKTKRIYYVRVRMYQMVAGKKIYGKWSKVKKKKTK